MSDGNFPSKVIPVDRYNSRVILPPSFSELKSIFSTAASRAINAEKGAAELKEAQDRIRRLWSERLMLTEGLSDLARLSPEHRASDERTPFTPSSPNEGLTQSKLTSQNFELIQNLTKLTLASFEKDINTRVVMTGSKADDTGGSGSPTLTLPSNGSTLVGMSKALLENINRIHAQPLMLPAWDAKQLAPPFMLKPTAPLANETKSLLDNLKVNAFVKPIDAVAQDINKQLLKNAIDLDTAFAPYQNLVQRVQHVAGSKIQYLSPISNSWRFKFNKGILEPPRLRPLSNALFEAPQGRVTILGDADLLIVKQQLVGHEGGEVAYIVNVLSGETQSHEVNTLASSRREITAEGETMDSTETETTTTERFEVSSESEKVLKESISAEAGLTVSASYGPFVSVSANASFAYDRDQSDSKKAAERYAKDVTSKATSKIAKRMLQRTVTTDKSETRTKDIYSFENTGANAHHTSGVYQWMNKVYEAQTWNYGKRTILDFMIPEPGAFYLDKQINPLDTSGTLFSAPNFDADPSDLDAEIAAKFGSQYGMTDLDPPPQEFSRASSTYAVGDKETHAKADKIMLPVGYQVTGISLSVSGVRRYNGGSVVVNCVSRYLWPRMQCNATLLIPAQGNAHYIWDPSKDAFGRYTSSLFAFPEPASVDSASDTVSGSLQQAEIAWSVVASGMEYFAVTIELLLQATPEAKRNWQNKTWAKLRAAADKQMAEQQAAIDNAKFNSAFQGRDPERNKEIVRNEIKKSCISIMTDSHFDEIGANNIVQISATKSEGGLPMSEINIEAAQARGPYVRFFEEAFEWGEMTWMLFPYFWGRKDHWYNRVDYEDDDPEFEKFVQAGFAPANVPVRPSFQEAVAHYLETGSIWMGGPLPGIGTEMHLPLVTDIQESLGRKESEPKRNGEPWTVKVPTTLVRLRHDDKTPTWLKDPSSGIWKEQPDGGIEQDKRPRASTL